MFLSLFLLLVAYYVLRTIREPLILASGAEVKSYASAGQALVLVGFVPFYGWFASKVDRMKLIVGFILFFIVNIELFSLGGLAGVPRLGVLFYIWVGIFSLATVAQFWSYANDIYRREAGERLFALIFLGASLGAPVGAEIAALLFARSVGPYTMMHVSAALLCVHLLLYWIVDRRESKRRAQAEAAVPLQAATGRLRAARAEPLPAPDLPAADRAQPGEHHGRLHPGHGGRGRGRARGPGRGGRGGLPRRLLRELLLLGHRAHGADPGAARLAHRQVPGPGGRADGAADRGAGRVRLRDRGRHSFRDQVGEDGRERHRLFGDEHRRGS